MKLVLDPIWSWPVVAFAIGALLALVLMTYPPRIRHLPPLYRRLLLGLRLAGAVLLVLAMLRPAIQHRETDSKTAVLLVIGDQSRSMGTKDAPGGISRRDQMLKTLSEIDTQIEALADEIEIHYYDFAEKDNEYRKRGTGMALKLERAVKRYSGLPIDWKRSFMVGDSAWKRGKDKQPDGDSGEDFSNSDRLFAENVRREKKQINGFFFHHPRDYFGWSLYGVNNFHKAHEVEKFKKAHPGL